MDFPKFDFSTQEGVIQFQTEDVVFEYDARQTLWQAWIMEIISANHCQLSHILYIFCSDDYLHQVNLTYLQHDTYTDIITFPYQEPPIIEGDIMISLDRVRENAESLSESFDRELARVMIHGVLHLCGQNDKTPAEELEMRQKEDAALAVLEKMS